MFAQVIVDVPTQQTDRLFTYEIPSPLLTLIEPGIRVQVPFNHRQVEAFVVEISEQTDFAGEILSLSAVIDDEVLLNKEQLALSKWLADYYYSFQIDVIHAMMPSLLKVHYEKKLAPTPHITYFHSRTYFNDRGEISWEDAQAEGILPNLLKLKRQGEVAVHYALKTKGRIKQERWLKPLLDHDAFAKILQNLPKQAKRQQDLCAVLMDLDGKGVTVKSLQETYLFSLGTLKTAEKKGWLQLYQKEASEFKKILPKRQAPLVLLPEQKQAYDKISKAIRKHEETVFLLEGVTGSGKTEIYLQLIDQVLKRGETALLLLPEISLTPQMLQQLEGRFQDQVATLHSGLTMREQFKEWQRIKTQKAKVVVGARSSVFAPLEDIGLIILDEEHETTFKQENSPRYHAREVAKWRSHYHHCPVILGSATPSLESRARAQNGVYQYLQLKNRTNQKALPESTIIDMREEFAKKNYHQLSTALYQAMAETLEKGQQVALLLNRRGYANYLMCRTCGHVFKCPNCDVSLTYHYKAQLLKCHYCGYQRPKPSQCSHCHQAHIQTFGSGIERVEQELLKLFPDYRLVRIDNDSTRRKGSLERQLREVESKKARILLGTQMIAKGLNFPNITLVGIINADTSLYLPDFRSAERTFQLLTQVSGRAGRGDIMGRVFIQTYNPDHYAIQCAKQQNYQAFYQLEMAYRKQLAYSPYYYTIRISCSHMNEQAALQGALEIKKMLNNDMAHESVILTGPSKSAIARVKNRYYFQILCRYRNREAIDQAMKVIQLKINEWAKKKLYISIDVEPLSFM